MNAYRNLKLIGISLLILTLAGTVGFHFIEGWSWFDSFYMVLTTVTTIGYSEVHPLSSAGKVLNVFVIVAGVGLVFLGIGALTAALLEFELHSFFGRRRMEREIGRLSGHYIICGAGRVGRSAAREFQRKRVPFVVVENNPAKLERFPEEWLSLNADATQESTLRQARIEQARGLVAATTTDAVNVYIVLTARGLNEKLKIIARASEEGAEKHLRTAGADDVISPYVFAGHRIAWSFLRPHVVDFFDVVTARTSGGGLELEIEEVQVEPSSPFAGSTIESSRIRQDHGVIVLAIKGASGMRFNPQPEDPIAAGDFLIAMGEPGSLRRLQQTATAKA